MMKRHIALLLSFIMLCSVLVGCGTKAPSASAPSGSGNTSEPSAPTSAPSDAQGGTNDEAEQLPEWKYTFEWSDGGTKEGVGYAAANLFKDIVEERTGGNVTFNLHWESELFGPPAEIDAIKAGEIDMAGIHHAFAGSASPLIEFCSGVGARGVFSSLEHYWRFVDTPEIRKLIEDEVAEKFNSKLLWLNPASNSTVASSKPIHTIEDFENLQIRTPGTASANAYQLLGANPVSMSASEIYMALERGVIDAADTGSDEIYYKAFYEVTPYIVRDYTCYPPHALFSVNMDVWNSMPEEYQQIFLEAAAESEAYAREEIVNQDEDLLAKLEPLVEEIYLFPEEEAERANEILAPATKETFFANNDPDVAQMVWDVVEATREG